MPMAFELLPSEPLGIAAAVTPLILAERGALLEKVMPGSRMIRRPLPIEHQ